MKGDNRRQRETRRLERPGRLPHQPTPIPHEGRQPETRPLQRPRSYHTNQHPPPHKGRQPKTTGDKTTSEAKKATTPTNTYPIKGENRRQRETRRLESPGRLPHQPTPTPTHKGRQPETKPLVSPGRLPHQPTPAPHMKGDNRRQWETTGDKTLQSPRSRPHQPTPTPHMKGDNRRQWETTGDKTTSEPKMAATPTNTHPPHEGRQPETMGDNGRQDHFRAQEADHTNQHPPPT